MSMKNKIYLTIITISIMMLSFSLYLNKKSMEKITQENVQNIYQKRLKEYKVFYETKKNFLDSFAKFLASSNITIQAYLHNDRQLLINYIKPLYKNLHSHHIIEEIHFFKRPAISFVNFANLEKYNFSVAKAREDITWIDTSFQPSTHFYICRLYPGLRATYPIIYHDRLLGSISFGINIKEFKTLFEKVGAQKASIYINNIILKKMLLPAKYKKYKNLPLYKNYKVMGEAFNIKLTPGYELKNNKVYTKIKLKDFFGNTMGFLVIEDDISKSTTTLNKILKIKMITEIMAFLTILLTVFLLFKWLFYKMDQMNNILYLIKTRQFSKIPPKIKPKDELDIYKNNVIDVAQRVKAYISLLDRKVEEFSNKAYKDGLTEILNRRFLEEKADEIFIKYNTNYTHLGVIMIDIDNFKHINDTYGHNIGDLVLTQLAKTIKNEIRKEDIFVRYGGEEFLLLLPNSNIENTFKVAEKIRKEIEKLKTNIGDKNINFTISLGVSEINVLDESLYNAIKRADENLYKAKKNGKNRVEV